MAAQKQGLANNIRAPFPPSQAAEDGTFGGFLTSVDTGTMRLVGGRRRDAGWASVHMMPHATVGWPKCECATRYVGRDDGTGARTMRSRQGKARHGQVGSGRSGSG
jgi:hypothetical protein